MYQPQTTTANARVVPLCRHYFCLTLNQSQSTFICNALFLFVCVLFFLDEEQQRNETYLGQASLPVLVAGILGCFESVRDVLAFVFAFYVCVFLLLAIIVYISTSTIFLSQEEDKSKIKSYLRQSVIGLAQSAQSLVGPEIMYQELR